MTAEARKWALTSWRNLPAAQQPAYRDPGALRKVLDEGEQTRPVATERAVEHEPAAGPG